MITFNLKIYVKLHIHTEKLLAGANRNRAAKAAIENGATILHFFDVDDIMHPRRIEKIMQHFEEKLQITGILNKFIFGPKDILDLHLESIPWKPVSDIIYENAFLLIGNGSAFRTHSLKRDIYQSTTIKGINFVACGPISVRALFWEAHPYDEAMRIGEDQHFNANIIEQGHNLSYIPDNLSVYMTGGRTEFDCICMACDSKRPIEAMPAAFDRRHIDNLIKMKDITYRKIEMLKVAVEAQKRADMLKTQMELVNNRITTIHKYVSTQDTTCAIK